MNNRFRRFSFFCALVVCLSTRLLANVTITSPAGGNNLSADKALNSTNGAAFTSLGNIVITEGASTDFAVGNNQTLILTPPSGWRFNAGVGSVTYQGSRDTTAASLAVTASNVTVTLSVGGTGKNDVLTISGLQVQPLTGENAPLAGYIRRNSSNPGTATMAGIIADVTNFGLLNTIAGAAKALAIQTQPSITAVAGVPFETQPEVKVIDQFGNVLQLDTTTVAVAARAAGSGTLQGTLTRTAIGGIVSYTDLWHPVNSTITIQFTATNLASVTSDPIVIGPASADRLVFTTEPAAATAGAPFGVQPVLRTRDVFGGNSIAGLPGSQIVTVTLTSGTGELLGTTTADIGTNAGNGIITFTDFKINAAGPGKQLTATSPGLFDALSVPFTVNPGPASQLTIQTPPSATATAGSAFAQQPVVRIEDAYGNLRTTDNTTVITASRATGTGNLQGTTSRTAAGGVVAFNNLTYNVAEMITLDFSGGGLPVATSGNVAVSPAAASKLTIQTQPSAGATAGAVFAQQPVIRIEDPFGNLRTADNTTVVTAARSSGNGTLQGATSVTALNGVVNFANLSHNVATNITIQFTSGSLSNATSTSIAVSPAAASKLTILTQPSPAATAGVVFAQQPALRIEDAFGNLITSDSATVVTATRNAGSGALQGMTSRTANAGVVNFTNLSHQAASTISIDFAGGSLIGTTSSNVVVNPAAANHLAIQTQPSPAAMAGVVFAQQPVIRIEDQFNNLCANTNLTITATRNAGSGALQGATAITTAGGVAAYTNLSHNVAGTITINFAAGGLTPMNSDSVHVSAGAANRLTIQAQPAATATAGAAFAQQPLVRIEDAVGNLITDDNTTIVTAARLAGSGTLQGTVTATAVNGIATFASLSHNVATSITIQFTSGSLASATSSTIAVSPAAADHLTLQTPPSSSATAGALFAQQPVIRIEDAFGNLRSSDNATVVTVSRATGSAALQGTTNRTAVGGVVAFTDLSYNVAETITFNFAGGSVTPAISGNVVVSPAAANRLTIQAQPSALATAGMPFAQQPVIRIEDQFGNLRSSDNSTVVTATRLAGSGTLQGTTSVTAANGVVVFAGLSHLLANTITIQFTSGSLSNATSSAIAVGPGAFAKLQLLVPGETAAPGTALGKTGTPNAQLGGVAFDVTVNAVDANWNLLNSVTDTVGITSSDAAATLPVNAALLSGTRSFPVSLNTAGTATLTASDVSDNSKTASTSPGITVSSPQYTAATGGSAISADATGGTYTNLTGPVYTEVASGNVGMGTIILNSPGGFVFDIGGTAPTVRINGGTSSKNINGVASGTSVAMTSVTTTQLTFTVTKTSSAGTLCTLTWQNVRVRPAAGTPLASGNLTAGGTASVVGVTTNSNFGTLREIVGGARRLALQMQPSATATAGVAFAQQPVVQVQDQFGNWRTNDSTTVVNASRSAGSGTLQGTTNRMAVAGLVTFTNLSYNVATNISILFTGSGLTNATSSTIAVSPAAATTLVFAAQPDNATAGASFGTQPVLKSQDAFGNNSAAGLPANLSVAVGLTSGTGPLQGTVSADLGTAAGNGIASFSDLRMDVAGANKQLTATASGLGSVASGVFTVSPAAVSKLTIQIQPTSSATAGVAFAQQPVIRIEDAFGNLRSADNTTVVSVARNLGTGPVQGTTTATASGGIATFANLNYTVAETMNMSFTSGVLLGATSLDVTVSAAAANKLTIQTQPSATATAGLSFSQQPVIRIEDTFGNLRSSDNATVVTAARSAGSGTLQGTTGATAANGVVTFVNLSHIVATNITLQFTSAGLSNTTSTTVTVSPAAASRLAVLTQPSPTAVAGVNFAQQPVLKVEDAFGNLITSDSATIVTATRNAGSGTLQGATSRTAANGIVSFTNLSHQTAGTISMDFAGGSLTGATSANVVVNPAAPDHLVIQTQPSPIATAGAAFAQQPIIRVEDQFGNLCANTNLTVTATRNAGSGTLQGTTSVVSVGGVASYTNLAHNVAGTITINFGGSGLSPVTSEGVLVNQAAASRLGIQTQPSATATAGVTFPQQPVVRIEDALGNVITNDNSTVVTATRSAGGGTLQGTVSATTVNGIATFANLYHTTATNITLQFNASGLTNATSATIAVSAAAAAQLTIQTQPSATATAGSAFAQQPVIRIEDAFGNLRSSDNATVVTASRATGSGTLQGITSRTAAGGMITFTNLSYNVAETITIGFSSSSLSSSSSSITVSPTAASRLTIQTQPASTASAGVAFAQQPVIRVEDQFGNLRSVDNSTVVTATRAAGSGTLQGATNVTAINGVVTFANLSHNLANNITIQFVSGALSNATSGVVAVSPGAFAKLQLLVPGETAAPATPSGKTGTPSAQTALATFNVTVNAVDANWNPINTVTDLVAITSTDAAAMLPGNMVLTGGTQYVPVTFSTNGSFTLTATDVSDGTKTASTSPAMTVSAAQFTPTSGGSAISADATGGSFTNLVGPVYREAAAGNVGLGTIILNAPTGFIFDTGGTAPTVRIDGGTASKNINGATSGSAAAMTSVTSTQLTFAVTKVSGVACIMTWQNVRVRPAAGTPLANGHLRVGGTASLATVSTNSSFGLLREVAGAARKLAVATPPSPLATAGVLFAQQPVIQVQDQFGNLRTGDNASIVSASRNAGSGVLQGTTNRTAAAGLVSFTNLAHNVATNITILFASGSLTNVTSTAIAISPANAAQLVFTTQPANGTVGALLGTQPVVRSRDAFGNDSAVGLGDNRLVTLALSSGSGSLLGTTTLDLGASAGNGVVSFAGLIVDAAGTDKRLTASAVGMSDAISSVFTVAQGNQAITFGALGNKTYGDPASTLSATASSGLPVNFSVLSGPASIVGNTLTITGAGTVTVRAAQAGDANWSAASPVDRSFTVAKASLTVTAENQTRAYGASNPTLTASFSGFVNGESASVLSGTPSLSTTATAGSPVSGSPYSITAAAGTLASANYSFIFADGSLTVTKALLTVTADDQSRVYGAVNPALTFTCTGFVNSESLSVLSGSPELSTVATNDSSVAGSPYAITAATGTLETANYDFTFVPGTLTITPASLAGLVTSSANPSPTGSNVTFTVTLSAVTPSAGIPTGTVQFLADGAAFGSPPSLSGGEASLASASLPHGTHSIVAAYAGDGNFHGLTNNLAVEQVINSAPKAAPATYSRLSNSSVKISIADLLANYTSDVDGDVRTLVAVGAGTNGATITVVGEEISYVPSESLLDGNAPDHFEYVITDGFAGCLVTNKICVTLDAPVAPDPAVLTGLNKSASGVTLSFSGVPGYTYHVRRTTALAGAETAWVELSAVTTDGLGLGEFTDAEPPSDQAFYQIVWP